MSQEGFGSAKSPEGNLYDRLGVNRNSSEEEISSAFRNYAKKHHPDAGGDAEAFKNVSEAYNTLKDAKLRAKYNEGLGKGHERNSSYSQSEHESTSRYQAGRSPERGDTRFNRETMAEGTAEMLRRMKERFGTPDIGQDAQGLRYIVKGTTPLSRGYTNIYRSTTGLLVGNDKGTEYLLDREGKELSKGYTSLFARDGLTMGNLKGDIFLLDPLSGREVAGPYLNVYRQGSQIIAAEKSGNHQAIGYFGPNGIVLK